MLVARNQPATHATNALKGRSPAGNVSTTCISFIRLFTCYVVRAGIILLPDGAAPLEGVNWPVGTIISTKDGCTIVRGDDATVSNAAAVSSHGVTRGQHERGRGGRGIGRGGRSTSHRAGSAGVKQGSVTLAKRGRKKRKTARPQSTTDSTSDFSDIGGEAGPSLAPVTRGKHARMVIASTLQGAVDVGVTDFDPEPVVLRQPVLKALHELRSAQHADPVHTMSLVKVIEMLEHAEFQIR